MKILIAVAAVAVLVLGGFAVSTSAVPAPPSQGPYVSLSGPDGHVKEAGYVRITTREDWAKQWLRNLGEKPSGKHGYDEYYNPKRLPRVDFTRCFVLAIYKGECWNCTAIDVKSVDETKDRLRVRFRGRYYQTMGPDGGGEEVAPYGFFILPKTTKPIVIEEDVHGTIGGDPVWKERARLD